MPHLFATNVHLTALGLMFVLSASASAQTTIQLPTFGVAVDAAGVLEAKTFRAANGQLRAARRAAAVGARPGAVEAFSGLRKISLVRLGQAIRRAVDQQKPIDETMHALAGLQQVRYLFCYPDRHDIVLAGPAEGWMADGAGRNVGLTTGRPVLELQDLAVALRAYPPGRNDRPFIGCTIDPNPAGLARLQAFQKTIPSSVRQNQRAAVAARIAEGTRKALGMSTIRVFGIPAETHMSHVMVEADYRMKRIGIGLEPPPVKMTTFLGTLRSARNGMLQRWWFQPDYDCVRVSEDRLAMELIGQGVQLLAEDMAIGPNGALLNPKAQVGSASRLFTTSFTKKYPKIAAASPVYAQMKNAIDLLVAAAYLQRNDLYGRAAWDATTLLNEDAVPTRTFAAPRHVPCNVNVTWKGNRLLSPAGGVSILPHQALDPQHLKVENRKERSQTYQSLAAPEDVERWWWD